MAPRAVLMKTGLKSLNTARPINTAHPKTIVYSARPMLRFSKLAQSTVKRHYQTRTALTKNYLSQKVNTTKGKVNTASSRAVNTARPNSSVVNAVRANKINVVKASACWVWRPIKHNSESITLKRIDYVDARGRPNGCSMHMTRNMPYLLDFKGFDGGYVTFGEEPKRDKQSSMVRVSDTNYGVWQTATVKESSNPLMADSLPKTIVPTKLVKPQGFNLRPNTDEAVYKERDDSLVRSATTASSLEAEQDSGNINKTQSKATPNESSFQGTNSGGGLRGNTLRSGEDSLKLEELMKICTKLQERVLALEKTNTFQAAEIAKLKKRVKKLEKKDRKRTHGLKRLFKVGTSARIVSSDEASLGDQEDASKQGRKIDDIDKDVEITLVDETQGRIQFALSSYNLRSEELFGYILLVKIKLLIKKLEDSEDEHQNKVTTASIVQVETAKEVNAVSYKLIPFDCTANNLVLLTCLEVKKEKTSTFDTALEVISDGLESDMLLLLRTWAGFMVVSTVKKGAVGGGHHCSKCKVKFVVLVALCY
ncbi:hypothetical protein Tco_1418816 [Tanacetum coccineum]